MPVTGFESVAPAIRPPASAPPFWNGETFAFGGGGTWLRWPCDEGAGGSWCLLKALVLSFVGSAVAAVAAVAAVELWVAEVVLGSEELSGSWESP